jgi:hypothetical protein
LEVGLVAAAAALALGTASAGKPAAPVDFEAAEAQVYSQGGEDGVIAKLFEVIEPTSRYAVEFGAADGLHGSNVRRLYEQGWSGLQIEGDPSQYKALLENMKDFPKVKNLRGWVWPGNIEHIFDQVDAPKDMDLLVIDIDSNDYWVWKVIHDYRPKVVQVEFNAAFAPPQLAVIRYHPMNYPDSTDFYGASIQSFYELAKRKGYELVYCEKNAVNLFFVDAKYFDRFGIEDNSPAALYRPPSFGYAKGGRAPNGRGWPPAETRGPLSYGGGTIPKAFLER